MINVSFFAMIREHLGCENIRLEYEGQHNIADIKETLASRGDEWGILTGTNVLAAVNQTLCGDQHRVHDGDEIAFFPPVTGG